MKYLPLLLLIIFSFCVKAQNRNNVWMLGYPADYPYSYTGDSLYFNYNSIDTALIKRAMWMGFTDASICDTSGKLLFYSNGIYINNRDHDTLFNSAKFNPGYATDLYGSDDRGSYLSHTVLIIPRPLSNVLYDVFSVSGEKVKYADVEPLTLRHSVVDMLLNNGLGGINSNNLAEILFSDTLINGRITACKHANGRDWWVITHKYRSDIFYKFLLTPDTILGPFEQVIGTKIIYDLIGQSCFSPDGNWFAQTILNDTCDVMRFDRCTGEFSDCTTLVLNPPGKEEQIGGCAFSASSRFIYVSSTFHIYQLDLLSNNIQQSEETIGVLDSTNNFESVNAFLALAPNGKIYISAFDGVNYLHVIENPDSLGISCNFVYKGQVLPQYNSGSIPNSSNYDLGRLIGSPCDTLFNSTAPIPQQPTFSFTPNPSSDYINVVYAFDKNATLTITNAVGNNVKQLTLYAYFKNRIIYTNELPAGIYLVTITSGENRISKKLIVAR